MLKQQNRSLQDDLCSYLVEVRNECLSIAREIGKVEPNLTDHSSDHIYNVLNNVYYLIKNNIEEFNYIELYFLCIIVFLHDVGNIEGRDGHNKKLANIYNKIRRNDSNFNQERNLVLQAVAAHCGVSQCGSRDTLSKLSEDRNLFNKKLRLRQLAAILRFADELAEGPQRTCDYMLEQGIIKNQYSLLHHVYSQVTTIFIDVNRIAVTYNIDVANENVYKVGLKSLLEFIIQRIIKLDEERRYCKYYTDLLCSYKQTHVTFNITKNGYPIIDLPELRLMDKFNLYQDKDNSIKEFYRHYPDYDTDKILNNIKDQYDENNK